MYETKDFVNEMFFYPNVEDAFNILIYGNDAHQYFFGKYNNEEFHEFCHVF